MKNKTKIILVCASISAAALSLVGCAVWDTAYDELDRLEGKYTVSVRFDINGGTFASNSQSNISEVFSQADAKKGVKLVDPDSEQGRKLGLAYPSRTGYYLAGWYEERTPYADEAGNALDDYGEKCSESGLPQGYSYGKKWDFDKRFVCEDSKTSSEYAMTLYAAWVPNSKYVFLVENEAGEWEQAVQYEFNPMLKSGELALPYWEDEKEGVDPTTCSGAMTYGDFPRYVEKYVENDEEKQRDKTFSAIYRDKEKQNEITEPLTHSGSVNLENGTAVGAVQTYYTEWLDGTWYHIYSASQFAKNAQVAGRYEIYRDLDFGEMTGEGEDQRPLATWSAGLARGDFSGKLVGVLGSGETTRKISNITVNQTDISQLRGGLFGRLMAKSELRNVTFENVTYNLNAATRYQGGEYGLLAGNIAKDAVLENVHVTGAMHVGNIYSRYNYYSVGLITSNITSLTADQRAQIDANISLVVDPVNDKWPHKATVNPDGTVTFEKNPDNTQNPNLKSQNEQQSEVI